MDDVTVKSFDTRERTNNGLVLRLGEYLKEEGSKLVRNHSPQLTRLVQQFVADFNVRIATQKEFKQWLSFLDSIAASRWAGADAFTIVLKSLFQQLRCFHNTDLYPDLGAEQGRKIELAGFKFKDRHALKHKLLDVIRAQQLEKPLNKSLPEYELVLTVLRYHPRAEHKLREKDTSKPALTDICVGKNAKSSARVLMLKYADGSTDDISFGKCLPQISDPAQDEVRKLLTDAIWHFVRFYKSSHLPVIIDSLQSCKPPPEFQQIQGKFVSPQLTTDTVVNYLKGLLTLCKSTGVQAFQPESYPENVAVSIDSLDCLPIHRAVTSFILSYLHEVEIERSDLTAVARFEEDAYIIWRNEQFKKLAALLSGNKVTETQRAKAKKYVENPQLLRALYDELRTTEDVSPVLFKLDEVFSTFCQYLQEEIGGKKLLSIRRTTLMRRFDTDCAKVLNAGEEEAANDADDASVSSAFSSTSKQVKNELSAFSDNEDDEGLGLVSSSSESGLSSTSSGRRSLRSIRSDGKKGKDKEIRVVNIIFETFVDGCIQHSITATDSPILPFVFFFLVNINFTEFSLRLCNELFKVAENSKHPADMRARAVIFLGAFMSRSAHLSSLTLQESLLRLSKLLMKENAAQEDSSPSSASFKSLSPNSRRMSSLSPSSRSPASNTSVSNDADLRTTLFSIILEVLSTRWDVLREEVESRSFFQLLSALAYTDANFDGARCIPAVVRRCACEQISRDFQIDTFPPFKTFCDVENLSLQAEEWPARPLDETELHRFKGYVLNLNDWLSWTPESVIEVAISKAGVSAEERAATRLPIDAMVVAAVWGDVTSEYASPRTAKVLEKIAEVSEKESSSESEDDSSSDESDNEEIESTQVMPTQELELPPEDVLSNEGDPVEVAVDERAMSPDVNLSCLAGESPATKDEPQTTDAAGDRHAANEDLMDDGSATLLSAISEDSALVTLADVDVTASIETAAATDDISVPETATTAKEAALVQDNESSLTIPGLTISRTPDILKHSPPQFSGLEPITPMKEEEPSNMQFPEIAVVEQSEEDFATPPAIAKVTSESTTELTVEPTMGSQLSTVSLDDQDDAMAPPVANSPGQKEATLSQSLPTPIVPESDETEMRAAEAPQTSVSVHGASVPTTVLHVAPVAAVPIDPMADQKTTALLQQIGRTNDLLASTIQGLVSLVTLNQQSAQADRDIIMKVLEVRALEATAIRPEPTRACCKRCHCDSEPDTFIPVPTTSKDSKRRKMSVVKMNLTNISEGPVGQRDDRRKGKEPGVEPRSVQKKKSKKKSKGKDSKDVSRNASVPEAAATVPSPSAPSLPLHDVASPKAFPPPPPPFTPLHAPVNEISPLVVAAPEAMYGVSRVSRDFSAPPTLLPQKLDTAPPPPLTRSKTKQQKKKKQKRVNPGTNTAPNQEVATVSATTDHGMTERMQSIFNAQSWAILDELPPLQSVTTPVDQIKKPTRRQRRRKTEVLAEKEFFALQNQ